jgi:hypothetical protein
MACTVSCGRPSFERHTSKMYEAMGVAGSRARAGAAARRIALAPALPRAVILPDMVTQYSGALGPSAETRA